MAATNKMTAIGQHSFSLRSAALQQQKEEESKASDLLKASGDFPNDRSNAPILMVMATATANKMLPHRVPSADSLSVLCLQATQADFKEALSF